jgi:cellulose synthase/poly-beta-1,6-N-acetylglucosamine synthase-like glycosyltransferase
VKLLVSILIPAHNIEKSLTETIRSAVAQTWPEPARIALRSGTAKSDDENSDQPFDADYQRLQQKKTSKTVAPQSLSTSIIARNSRDARRDH